MPRSRRCPGGGNGINIAWRIPWTEEPGRLQSMRSGSQDQTRFINWVHTHIYNKSEECLLKKEHWWCLQNTGSVVSDRGGGGGLLLWSSKPRSRGLATGAELPTALHTSSLSEIFQSHSHWWVPTDLKKGASLASRRSRHSSRQETRKNVLTGMGKTRQSQTTPETSGRVLRTWKAGCTWNAAGWQETHNRALITYAVRAHCKLHAPWLRVTDGSQWRVLINCGTGVANHSSILALTGPWTVQNGKQVWHWTLPPPPRWEGVRYWYWEGEKGRC